MTQKKYVNLMMAACGGICIISLPNYLASHIGIQVSPGA